MTNSKDDRIDASSPAPELPGPVADITRLPQPLTSFVDREIDVAKVASLLGQDGVRLVTLTGTDGVGKTRHALYVADEVASAFPDGVDYVSLSTVTDPEQVLPAIARSRQGTGGIARSRRTGGRRRSDPRRADFGAATRRHVRGGEALQHLGAAALAKRHADAINLVEQALDHYPDDRDDAWRAMRLTLLGLAAHRVGDAARAEPTRDEAITLSARHRGAWEQALGLNGLASVVRSRGETAQAAGLYAESLHVAERLGDATIATEAMIGFAGVLADSSRVDEAARLFGAAEVLNEAMGISGEHLAAPHQYRRDISDVRERLGDEAFATAWAQGRTMPAHELLGAARAAVERGYEPRTSIRSDVFDRRPVLTPREREVLNLLANRLSDREIGSLLYIGTRTAEFHVANVIGKLGVANRRETAAVASQLGLV